MAVSFGIAKKIIDHPSYNFGLALPFVCAFYVLNSNDPYVIPIIGFSLNHGITTVLNVLGVALYYVMSLFMFVLAGAVSKIVEESKGWLVLVAFFALTSLYSFLTQEHIPRVGLLFGALSAVYLLLASLKMESGSLSLLLVVLTGGVLSLLSFVLGILWFDGHYLFTEAIAKILGLPTIAPESLKIGAAMLITSGYVIYYAVFQTGELWGD